MGCGRFGRLEGGRLLGVWINGMSWSCGKHRGRETLRETLRREARGLGSRSSSASVSSILVRENGEL